LQLIAASLQHPQPPRPCAAVFLREPRQPITRVHDVPGIESGTAYLWYGTERFELGQFDGDGKAIGALPAGIEISASDFAQGRVKLEEPRPFTQSPE
jgi:hypothetical protein